MTWRFWKTDASGLALMAMLAGGAYLAGFRPLLASWSNKSDLESRLRSETGAVESATNDKARLERQLDDLMLEIGKLEVTLLSRSRVNQRLDALTDLAAKIEPPLVVDSAIKAGEQDQPLFGVVQIRLRARGAYRTLAEFLRTLHLRYRDISVRSFEIDGEPNKEGDARISVELDWFVIPENRQKSR